MNAGDFIKQCVSRTSQQPLVRLGSSGPAVSAWQAVLGSIMKQTFPIRGTFEETTRAATIAFQRKLGLRPDGIVGPKTWKAAVVAPCYAEAVARAQRAPVVSRGGPSGAKLQDALRGVGALDFVPALDPKSAVLGAVLGLAVGAVLFARK